MKWGEMGAWKTGSYMDMQTLKHIDLNDTNIWKVEFGNSQKKTSKNIHFFVIGFRDSGPLKFMIPKHGIQIKSHKSRSKCPAPLKQKVAALTFKSVIPFHLHSSKIMEEGGNAIVALPEGTQLPESLGGWRSLRQLATDNIDLGMFQINFLS